MGPHVGPVKHLDRVAHHRRGSGLRNACLGERRPRRAPERVRGDVPNFALSPASRIERRALCLERGVPRRVRRTSSASPSPAHRVSSAACRRGRSGTVLYPRVDFGGTILAASPGLSGASWPRTCRAPSTSPTSAQVSPKASETRRRASTSREPRALSRFPRSSALNATHSDACQARAALRHRLVAPEWKAVLRHRRV